MIFVFDFKLNPKVIFMNSTFLDSAHKSTKECPYFKTWHITTLLFKRKTQLANSEMNLNVQCNIRRTTNAVTMEGYDNLLLIFIDKKLQK